MSWGNPVKFIIKNRHRQDIKQNSASNCLQFYSSSKLSLTCQQVSLAIIHHWSRLPPTDIYLLSFETWINL